MFISLACVTLKLKYFDVYTTNKTSSSTDDWSYYQVIIHLLLITITHWQYSTVSHLHNLPFTVAVASTTNFPWVSPAVNLSEIAENYFELNWNVFIPARTTYTENFIWNSLHNCRTDHTENISASIVETCALSHCIATVAALTIANPLLLRYPATASKHSFFYCCVPLEVSMAPTVTAWGKHSTLLCMRPYHWQTVPSQVPVYEKSYPKFMILIQVSIEKCIITQLIKLRKLKFVNLDNSV
jgi:hypothetical protein